jgi:Outer membrane protein beta-barrel domain
MLKRWLKYGCGLAGFLAITGIVSPRPVAAQGVDFAAGYSFLKDYELSENLPAGVFASVGVSPSSWLAIVGEIASNRKTFEELGEEFTLKVDFYGAGVRFRGSSGAARPWGQLLVGAARGVVGFRGESESGSEFAWQPGAGVDAYFSQSVGLRFGVNGRFIQGDDVTVKELQVIVGVVFGGR